MNPPSALVKARELLAGVIDTNIGQDAVLAACEAYNSLESASPGVWPPLHVPQIDDSELALHRAHALLQHTIHQAEPQLDAYRLGWALRETAAALVLLNHPGGAA